MQLADRIDADMRVLASALDRIEYEQARGARVLDDLGAAVGAWRRRWDEAAAAGYVAATYADRLERFREQAQATGPWSA